MSLEVKRSPINEFYFSGQAPRTEQFNLFPPSWTERKIFAFHEGRQNITRCDIARSRRLTVSPPGRSY